MINTTQSRWKSYILWSSLGGVLLMFLQAGGVFTRLGLTNEYAQYGLNTILTALIALGVINNPSDAEKV